MADLFDRLKNRIDPEHLTRLQLSPRKHGKSGKRKPKPPAPPLPIYTADLETDPFEHGKMIQPFAAGFYDGQDSSIFWGKDCIAKFFAYLETKPAGIIYIHNFGGFDFFWMLDHFTGGSLIRNGRILSTRCAARDGSTHELRDSYAILPMPLREYKVGGVSRKLDISIDKLRRENRAKHRQEILAYLRMDCVALHELVTRFRDTFGDKITVGSTAMAELKKVHDFLCIKTKAADDEIRNQFYYGGRVQCFEGGIIKAPLKVYDVNSMYPYVMKNYKHPVGWLTSITQKITAQTAFLTVEGDCLSPLGCFPIREHGGGLSFSQASGSYSITIHEYKAAKKLGIFRTKRILACYNFDLQRSFADFVNKFYDLRKQAKADKDDTLATFYKFILNSSYGKFAQDSSKYFDYQIKPEKDTSLFDAASENCEACKLDLCDLHWRADYIIPECGIIIWKRNNPKPVFYNVATGCSITGAARAVLMEAIHKAKRPIYCDTDSIICESLSDVPFSNSELGAWKLEAKGNQVAIAGKKLYALWQGRAVMKYANKGVQIEPKDIRHLAMHPDNQVTYEKDSPTFKVNGTYSFLHRTVRATV